MAENYNYGGSGGFYRDWMYKRFDEVTGNLSAKYVAGVEQFMTFANSQPIVQSSRGKFHCPCSVCKNEKHIISGGRVSSHLFSQGFMLDYYVWYKHGEEMNMDIGTSTYTDRTYFSSNHEEVGNVVEDPYVDMVNDAFNFNVGYEDNYHHDDSYQNVEEPVRNYSNKFYDLLEGANNPLYDGCREGQSQLSLASRLMHNKAEYNMSEKLVDSVCEMFTDFLPEGNQATTSHYQTEKLMRNLGLPYHTIDVCQNNCMLFWKEDEKEDQCRFCGAQRWKPKDDRRRTKVPYSRMWYLPIGDRLKRMYQSHKTATTMRWHAEHQTNEGEMNHPSDAAEWRYFQELHPRFAEEPRNVYLGLCTDGFNQFGMSRNHSLWPVILTPYNLPPGMCMNTKYLFLTILNSRPNHPRGSLDVFLQPLIEELKELWSTGVDAYDVSLSQNFNLKAVLLWTIRDFPAYSMLSGWTTHGKLSCPVSMESTKSIYLPNGRKTCWKDLNLRHNIDVMHTEKNFLDNIMNTLLRVKGKSKDNIMSRMDIENFCSRPGLHIDSNGKAPFPAYSLTDEAKQSLFQRVKHDVRFPDDLENGKFSGMKSHGCHVFMERLLPFIFAELLDRNVHLALSGIGAFFRDLCSRTLQTSRVQILKENIVLIICNLEKILPPSFFDVMEHLLIHLPSEAELGGPVQYRWMYPFERFFKKLKGKVKNKRYAAGSIVESYINDEIAYFSEHYFADHIQTKSIMFEDCLTAKYPCLSEKELYARRAEEYHLWVKEYVTYWNTTSPFPTWVQEIVQGPLNKVKTWPMYFTRGYMFHTQNHGAGRKTCNYGVCVKGENYADSSDEADFYGTLTDIIELEYEGIVNLRITLFKCKWYDPKIERGTRRSHGGVVDVLSTRKYNKYEPFILGSQADQVCYIPYSYTKKPKNIWLNVLKVNPRENISGEYENNDPTLLQTENDDAVLLTTIENLVLENPVESLNPIILDYDVGDAEPEDEFRCNLSSSDEDEVEYEE
uniref:F9C16.30 n=1 Tax=Arabidopsis thaliana TaxID=3702 RepID=Q9LNY8_ARATH|nr:F9C16.30 [Arabidopsis thaliana]